MAVVDSDHERRMRDRPGLMIASMEFARVRMAGASRGFPPCIGEASDATGDGRSDMLGECVSSQWWRVFSLVTEEEKVKALSHFLLGREARFEFAVSP